MTSEGSANIAANFEVLTEGDVLGTSLDGKKPQQLNLVQLKKIMDPNKACKLRENLSVIENNKLYSADFAICPATTEKARK